MKSQMFISNPLSTTKKMALHVSYNFSTPGKKKIKANVGTFFEILAMISRISESLTTLSLYRISSALILESAGIMMKNSTDTETQISFVNGQSAVGVDLNIYSIIQKVPWRPDATLSLARPWQLHSASDMLCK